MNVPVMKIRRRKTKPPQIRTYFTVRLNILNLLNEDEVRCPIPIQANNNNNNV